MRELQRKIVEYEQVQPQIDPQVEVEKSINFIKAFLRKTQLKTLVLGISGGQDSTLAGKLAQMSIEQLRQETNDENYRFIAVRLPYGQQADESDAVRSLEWIKPDQTFRVNIQPAVDALVDSVQINGLNISDFNKGNIKARQRMVVQYAIAGDVNGCVIGTDHSAENVTGFYTKFGDGAADITPLFRLNKRQGKQILAYLDAPEALYQKVPTADLEEDRPGLADEEALGVTYQEIDDYLEGKTIDDDAAAKIEAWFLKTQHKRQLPYTIFDKI